MRNFYWFWFGLTLWGTRLVLLCVLYFTDAPTGGPIVDRWYRFFPHTLVIEAGVAMALAFAGGLFCTLLRGKARKVAGIVFLALGIAYMVTAGTDDEIMRWMGQHLSLSFITTYALAASDMGLVGRVFLGGAWHFLLTTFIVIAGIVGTVFLYRKMFAKWSEETVVAVKNRAAVRNWICLGIALALAITGLTSKNWFAPSNMRWKRIAPVAFRLVDEIKYKLTEAVTKEAENGKQIIGIKCPCLVTFTKPSFDPRYPTIKRKLAANRAKFETLGDDFDPEMDKAHYGLAGSPTHVKKSFTPPVKQGGMVIKEETGAESAAKLAQILVDNNII